MTCLGLGGRNRTQSAEAYPIARRSSRRLGPAPDPPPPRPGVVAALESALSPQTPGAPSEPAKSPKTPGAASEASAGAASPAHAPAPPQELFPDAGPAAAPAPRPAPAARAFDESQDESIQESMESLPAEPPVRTSAGPSRQELAERVAAALEAQLLRETATGSSGPSSPGDAPSSPASSVASSLASPPARGAPPSAPTPEPPSPPSASPEPAHPSPGRAEAKEGATPSAPALPSLPGQKPKPQSAPVSPGMPQSSLLRSAVRTDSEHACWPLPRRRRPAGYGGVAPAAGAGEGSTPAAESLAAFLSDGAFDAAQRQTAREEEGGPGRTPPRSAPPTAFSTTPPALPSSRCWAARPPGPPLGPRIPPPAAGRGRAARPRSRPSPPSQTALAALAGPRSAAPAATLRASAYRPPPGAKDADVSAELQRRVAALLDGAPAPAPAPAAAASAARAPPIPLASEGPAFGAAVDVDAAIREDAADEEEWEDTALDAAAVQVRAPPQATRSRSRLSAAASAEKLEPFMLFDANRS
eukprot:tig00021290_g19957.t1